VSEQRGVRVRRFAAVALLCVGLFLTLLGLLLVVGAWIQDASIDRHVGRANAEVVADSLTRTLVRYNTPDGAEHIPQIGVLYPEALEVGQVVQIEYDQRNPELVRVAGRGWLLTLLPVGTMLLAVWAVVGPLVWWLRSGGRLFHRGWLARTRL
jgi:hypothetical protein